LISVSRTCGNAERDRERGKVYSLPRDPTPKLESLLSDSPSATEILELLEMPSEEGESSSSLVVIEVELADFDGDAVGEDFGFGPAFRPRRKGRGRVEEEGEFGPAFFVVSVEGKGC